MFRKAFTVDEANALIPTMDRVLADVGARMAQVGLAAERLQILDVLWGEKLTEPENPDHAEGEACRLEIASAMAEIEELVEREIHGRDIRFPPGGLEHGLIDFPTLLEGRWVFLCWRRGEPEIEAWHELEAGFAGRQEVTPEQARTMGIEWNSTETEDGWET